MELLAFSLIVIAFIIAAFLTWFFIHKSKVEERKLLIEKGVDHNELPEVGIPRFKFPWLKIGCVFTLGSIGIMIGLIFDGMLDGSEPLLGMLIFGGFGMILAHFIDKQ